VLKALTEEGGRVGRRLVALTGDGIPVNTIYRDAEFAWPVRTIPVPLVMFTHNNPFGWDEPGGPPPPPGYELRPPTSTEDVLHFAELTRLVVEAAFPAAGESVAGRTSGGLITGADQLLRRLHGRTPAFFDKDGNRLGGTGEYVVVLRPNLDPIGSGKTRPDGVIEAYRRAAGGGWERTRSLPVLQEGRANGRVVE
jgi:hypothetical protein